MVVVMSILLLLAESQRNKHECAWPNYSLTLMGSLISQDSLAVSLCGDQSLRVSFQARHDSCIQGHQLKSLRLGFSSPASSCFNQ